MAEPIKTKRCCICKQIKPLSEFHKHCNRKDRHQTLCKICHSEVDYKYHQTERGKEVNRKSKKRHRRTEKYKITQKHYHQSKSYKNIHRRYRIQYPNRFKAKSAVQNEIRANRLPRVNTLKCHYCPKQAKQYHHPSYEIEHWLDVIPVCFKCHRNIHNITPVLCV